MDSGDWVAVASALVAIIALLTSFWTYWITRDHLLLERVHRLTDRLYEFDRILIEYPEIQKFMYEQSLQTHAHFVRGTEHTEQFFRIKTFVYLQLNLWDEIFTVVAGNKRLEKVFEFEDWKTYIVKKMRHPLIREVFDRESSIWGMKIRQFVETQRTEILEAVDPEIF